MKTFQQFIKENKNFKSSKFISDFKIYETLYWGTAAAGIIPFCRSTKRFLIGLRSSEVYEPCTWVGLVVN